MSFDLSTITPLDVVRPPRIVLLGVEKIGKSTTASCADTPAMLPIIGEEGLDDPGIQKRAKVFPVCNHISDLIGWLGALHDQEHNHETVVIDSASALEALVYEEACNRLGSTKDGGGETKNIMKAGGGYGAGNREALVIWREITQWLDALRTNRGLASILIGHITVRRFDDPGGDSYDQYQWDIHEKSAALLYRWADSILFCNTKVVVKKEQLGHHKDNVKKRGIDAGGGNRFLFTQKTPAHPGGGRGVYGHLPYELPLSWDNFRDAVAQAMAS